MRPWPAVLLLLALPLGRASSADLEVSARDGRVTIRARGALLREVIDRLARETGMRVVYDGELPAVRVDAVMDAVPASEAVARLFEGHRVGYALMLDSTGRGVRTLVVAAAGAGGSAAAPSTRPTFPSPNDAPAPAAEPPPPSLDESAAPLDAEGEWAPEVPLFPQPASYPGRP